MTLAHSSDHNPIEALEPLILHEPLKAYYSRAVEIIDIEYESGQVSADFLNNPDNLISQKLQELKSMEAKNSDIRTQLEANEEVKKLS